MSETRALRDRLEETQAELRRAKEHLDKLRAHQARERESLQQQLEAARREVSGLRGRLEATESAGREPSPTGQVLPGPVVGERSEAATTALVALARNPASLESALPALSRLLKLAPVDVRFRLAPQPPKVLARLPIAQAAELRAALREEGFLAVAYEVLPRGAGGWVTVKRFELDEQGLSLEGTRGESLQVRSAELRLLMRGRRASTQVETKQEEETHYHGGRRHRIHKTVEEKRHVVENFVWVLGKGCRLAFTQATQFTGLGDLRTFTVHENLQRLMGELQRRAPHAVVDERFLQMPRFVMPLVDPERSQELLAELLFQAVDEGLWS
ncbi:hypothetical protein [Hyalangium sp.]|uniref:hypothetical protein n=1 Tax=Hyalangium sp. TaxID=2028555 RepID=UPI002D75CE02|nr:hypothetical protein [Hyalangium sp.]HYI00178.1 hypothetical protein [Hyalangium sp.]